MAEQAEHSALRQPDWPLRPWLLAALLALAGLAIHFLTDSGHDTPWRMAGAAFVFFGAIAVALTLDPDDWREPAVFSGLAGLVMGGLAFHAVDVGDHVAGEEFGFAAGVVATVLAVPLFQAGFHRTRFATPYPLAHYHAWSDAISGAGALAFTGLSWIVLALLNQLFRLVDIKLLGDLMRENWFGWTFSGAAFGAALGVLRNQLKVLAMLQSVAMLVLSLLAVPLALALLVFLVPLAMSGGQVLWDATRSPTPVLLSCAVGAFLLSNAVVRDDDAARSASRVMQAAAAVLAFGIFPLTLFAAISLGARVGQYGLSPERIWGLIAIGVAVACGLAYWVALARGRRAMWSERLRETNLWLAAAICAVALVVSLPVVDFGAISTRSQLVRLESGKVSAENFDYDALRWDFGDAGRAALAGLAKSGDATIAENAKEAQRSTNRYARGFGGKTPFNQRRENLRVRSDDTYWEKRIRDHFADMNLYCNTPCVAIDLGNDRHGDRRVKLVEDHTVDDFTLEAEKGKAVPGEVSDDEATAIGGNAMSRDSRVEVRPWNGRRVYVDGKPVGEPFK